MIKGFLVVFLWITFFPIPSFCQKATLTGKLTSAFTKKPPEFGSLIMVEIKNNGFVEPNFHGNYTIKNLNLNQKYLLIIHSANHDYFEREIILTQEYTILDIELPVTCTFDANVAKKDIESRKIKLFLFGSISPRANSVKDDLFEIKYKIQYYEFGCTPPSMECIEDYSKVIFAFLDKKYGRKWRKKVRDDVLFLD